MIEPVPPQCGDQLTHNIHKLLNLMGEINIQQYCTAGLLLLLYQPFPVFSLQKHKAAVLHDMQLKRDAHVNAVRTH